MLLQISIDLVDDFRVLDVDRLKVLVALARGGSVTAAAQSLHYAQPTVSHHLARLEAETGATLTQRVGRGVRLTEAGWLLARRGEEILGRLDAAEQELAALVGLRAGRVRLASFPSALGTIVPAATARLHASHPGVDIVQVEAEPHEAVRLLRTGRVDVAVVFRHLPEHADDDADLRLDPLLDERTFLLDASPGRARTPASVAVYADRPWIAGCERCRDHLLWLCRQAGFEPEVRFTTDDYVAVQALVAAGLGVAVLPELALRAFRHAGVRARPLAGTTRQVSLAFHGSAPDPPAVAALTTALHGAVGALPPFPARRPARQANTGR